MSDKAANAMHRIAQVIGSQGLPDNYLSDRPEVRERMDKIYHQTNCPLSSLWDKYPASSGHVEAAQPVKKVSSAKLKEMGLKVDEARALPMQTGSREDSEKADALFWKWFEMTDYTAKHEDELDDLSTDILDMVD